MYDAGISAQTLCLAAKDMGLGTVIMGVFDEDILAKLIGLPEGQTVTRHDRHWLSRRGEQDAAAEACF